MQSSGYKSYVVVDIVAAATATAAALAIITVFDVVIMQPFSLSIQAVNLFFSFVNSIAKTNRF